MKLYQKDKTYHELSSKVYNIKGFEKDFTVSISHKEQTFKVMSSRIDHENGFKAMAVAPVRSDGSVDKDEMYFAFAGTNLFEDKGADIKADAQILVVNALPLQINYSTPKIKKYSDLENMEIKSPKTEIGKVNSFKINQFDEGAIWVKSVIEKYNPKHKYGTGHSLGGAGIVPVGVMFDFDQVRTFSAPNSFSLLPPEIKKNFNNSKYASRIIDYSHNTDLIGTIEFLHPIIGKEFAIQDKHTHYKTIKGHGLDTYLFDGDHIVIKMDYEMLYNISKKLPSKVEFIGVALKELENYIDETKIQAKAIESKYAEKISNGGFEYISRSDIENYMQELSKTEHYDFYDGLEFEESADSLKKIKSLIVQFANHLETNTKEMHTLEMDLSEKFGLN
ncbi:hypothetical protein [Staphylococcus simulans]|uniref:hypothetical protein n=1 Tax=Staphylococcus simulans TaxID=1286 RepID=UPI000D1DAAC2|nr:hypothetical protein [Staphylococcus simulans]MDY5060898.1 hypothetical protein [Staphylococcus simulans]PTJ19298.1 hypothetical protein BU038_03905 [Staphylococcus simulans]